MHKWQRLITIGQSIRQGIKLAIEFNLPGSSFEEVQKMIKGYSHAPDNASLDALSKLTGLHTTQISRSNKFLTDIGLIAGGRVKGATDLGKRLGRALEHQQLVDAQRYWREAVQSNEKVSSLITTLRIKGGMAERDFSAHVLYVSGQAKHASNKTGARCVVELLLAAGLLEEENGKLVAEVQPSYASVDTEPKGEQLEQDARTAAESEPPAPTQEPPRLLASSPVPALGGITPQIAINIQLHLPETENAEVYEKLFKALRDNLISPTSA